MSNQHCYRCQAPKTSVEHVPPRCLFPQKKDLPAGVDLRKQLITVPSCDTHNSSKSKDDEYLLYALLMNLPNNETAQNYFYKKAVRAIKRNPSLINRITERHTPVTAVDSKTGEVHHTAAVQIDEVRLSSALESIGFALYFHHFRATWNGSVSAYPHFLMHITEENARELNEPNEKMQQCAEVLMKDREQFGDNPEVFFYQLADGGKVSKWIMYLTIYGGSKVTLLFKDG